MTNEFVKLEFEGPLALITVDRPKALNALNQQVFSELDVAISQIIARPDTRALIVTGGGEKAFVAGADIAEMSGYTPAQALALSARGQQVFARLEALAIPTIAAVSGFALGGGLELALACDLIFASEKAKLGVPEVSLAVIPGFGGTQRLTRLLGRSRAKELIFTGDPVDAAKAREIGLVLEVLAPEALLPRCKEVALKIASRGPVAVAQAKRVVEAGADLPLREANELERQAFAVLFGTDDQKEGMRAFLEKRKAAFKNA
ncbi:MAG: enoyl-CoA hydratase/isomerase family protein [Myxococcus sp.]|nr:enoyl-CoA hydratase/isomerase family protein [Myxococcus sp.]